jgi:hypothetical protein
MSPDDAGVVNNERFVSSMVFRIMKENSAYGFFVNNKRLRIEYQMPSEAAGVHAGVGTCREADSRSTTRLSATLETSSKNWQQKSA